MIPEDQLPLPDTFDVDAACAAALKRLYASINRRFAEERSAMRYGRSYRRSVGQTLRRLREKDESCRT